MNEPRSRDIVSELVLGCTDQGQHRWTTLYRWFFDPSTVRYPGGLWDDPVPIGIKNIQVVERKIGAIGAPFTPNQWREMHCPRCGRTVRFNGKPGGRGAALRNMDQIMRDSPGRYRLDISDASF